ncbi:uncharacterized protein N7496_010327 [Penicillium cataractarum]|uniref:Serine/threonine-protein kinase ATG1 n=1 Tax=Penicillium cataractarum TaxID=2100454 RepID=A0A9W9V1U8_9EURO|nr:uncharacterized protein N7496_010327 [Penicillium cataractarum]KAJ5364614.1 hypothetical protein N7496_010327 [Penicillium cataractarum]
MDYLPSDLVLDSRIQVEFSNELIYRFTTQSKVSSIRHVRRRPRKDSWQAVKRLGSGSFGTVTLHKCLTSDGQAELQAVKMIDKVAVSAGVDYYKELEAIAKFSQRKIAEGLKLLHENGFAHRDLKPTNIFVFRPSPNWWVKVGDFGFSKRINENGGLQTWVGTPVFLAPELQMLYSPGKSDGDAVFQYTEQVDMWALGVIAFYMVFHSYPFPPNKPTSLLRYIQGADLPFPKSPLSERLQNLLEGRIVPGRIEEIICRASHRKRVAGVG